MRDKLNDNPKVQMALVGVLLLVAAIFLLAKGGGGETEEVATATSEPAIPAAAEIGATPVKLPAPGTGPGAAPAPPREVVSAFDAGDTVVMLFIRDGGIDDRPAARAVRSLSSLSDVATFVVPATHVARYVSITQGVDLNRLPALIVIRPKRLDRGPAVASIQYGVQSPRSVRQAIVDAGYHGGTLSYHP